LPPSIPVASCVPVEAKVTTCPAASRIFRVTKSSSSRKFYGAITMRTRFPAVEAAVFSADTFWDDAGVCGPG
jgi:hypothetical protein